MEHSPVTQKKPDFRPVQDLHEVNNRVSDIRPTVPTHTPLLEWPATRLCLCIRPWTWKDAFFSLPMAHSRQEIFTFEWAKEGSLTTGQLT